MVKLFVELWQFMRHRKRFWLLPILLALLLVAILIVATESSVIAPYIYALF